MPKTLDLELSHREADGTPVYKCLEPKQAPVPPGFEYWANEAWKMPQNGPQGPKLSPLMAALLQITLAGMPAIKVRRGGVKVSVDIAKLFKG